MRQYARKKWKSITKTTNVCLHIRTMLCSKTVEEVSPLLLRVINYDCSGERIC